MTVWKTTDSRTKLGVVIYNYTADGQYQLSLDVGDTVHILEETTDWFRGYTTKNKAQKGIFPRSYIHLKEATVHISGSVETITCKEPLLVQEVTSVLKEWHAIWKQLFVDKSPEVNKVKKMILDLMDWRSKLLTRKYVVDEQRAIQQQVTNLIDSGNALLGLDLIVRDDQGNVLDPTKHSTIEIYKRHVDAGERVRKRSSHLDTETETRPTWPSSFNLFVMLRNFVCKIGEDADILMNLFDAREGKFISENYLVKWSKQGLPKDIDMLNNFRVVFTDLGSKDRMRERVFLVFQVVRIGVMDSRNVENKKLTQGIRRPLGVAAMDISEIIQGNKDTKDEEQYFIPFQHCGQGEFMDTVIKKVINAREINHRGQGLWVSLKVLPGDLRQVQEEQIHLVLPGTAVARKMGFPEVIMPGDVRNDIYITLMNGEFNKGHKTTDRNVEVAMMVCNGRGEVLKNVIGHGCGDGTMTEYKSMVYYHEDKPKWFETVKIAISTEVEFKGLHVKFVFRHKASNEAKDKLEKPFAMSYVHLMNGNGTTIEDKVHELLAFKIEGKKHDDSPAYLKLPSTRQQLEERGLPTGNKSVLQEGPYSLTPNSKDVLYIQSFVCSTKLTHNVDLLGLLKWQEVLNARSALECHLKHLMREEGEEIVKFLQDLLDSLFNILLQNKNNELCDNLVFDALVYIIALISDRKYHQFRPVLDAYIQTTFSFPIAYNKLIVILKDYVDHANEKTNTDSLLKAIKSLEYIFKIIIRSRCLFAIIKEGQGQQQFEISLKQLLTSINNMMEHKTDHTLAVQGAALKFISFIIGDVMRVFDPVELSKLMVEFIEKVPKDRLIKTKMLCIDQIIQTELFKLPACRAVLLPAMLEHTRVLMEAKDEMESCIMVLSHIVDQLWSPDFGPVEADVTALMRSVLRTVIQSVISIDRTSKLVTKRRLEQFFGQQPPPSISNRSLNENCVAVMISLLRQMTEAHYQEYINSFVTPFDLLDFMMEILMVFRDLVGRSVYPGDWLEMIMLQNSVILRALKFFAVTIHEKFSNPFEQQLWNNFFHCAISFLTQEPLQLDNFSVSKRNKIILRYKDMRREAAFEIRAMWFKLGPNKIRFIPELVGPFLEMTLIPETELRRATIPIFFDMMQCEYLQPVPNSSRIQGNFHEVENEMITQLDALVEGGRGDEQYRDLTYEILIHLSETRDIEGLREQSKAFVEVIWKLLERLLVYRNIIQDEIREHRMSCIVNLLDFYHDINRQEMYIRYLHKLSDLHLDCDNFTEAAYTLMLYAKLLQWSDEVLPPMLQNSNFQNADTHRELKERLYYKIISYFEQGKMWEKGIELCDELAQQYKEELFNYRNLSKILKKEAELYDRILAENTRPIPEYFRVGYYGQGFPSFLQNKLFIYRGKEYERLADFNARMQILFPNAELMKTLDPPSEEILSSRKQYLQINSVTPVMNLRPHFEGKAISSQILSYYRVNEVQHFTYSRRIDESVSDVTKMWLERTNMTTTYPLPGIVGWYPVMSTETVPVSPIEYAIENVEEKNKQLASAIEQHHHNPNLDIKNLGMLLNGSVDPAVQGGFANFKDFYIGVDYKPEDQERLKALTVEQVVLLREGLMVHKQKASEDLKPFHSHLEQRFSQMCNKMEQEYGIRVADKGFVSGSATLRRNQSLPSTSSNRRSDGSICSVHMPSDPKRIKQRRIQPGSMTTPRNSTTSRTQSVWVKDRSMSAPQVNKPQSKVSLSNIKKRVSQVTEQLSGDSSQRNSCELIELNEQLTPRRPPRPDSERRPSRPPSGLSLPPLGSKTNSVSSLASSESTVTSTSNRLSDASEPDSTDEQPPPIPEKQAYADYSNMNPSDPPPVPRRTSTVSTHRQKPLPPVPAEEPPPPPVPRKMSFPPS
ncbi:LOW QUALITY PROTEIN: dedicator of cytokinesis protein 1-like [Pomacea canaliculata]|uniref:LOW QUALITY PROTEIN: dedicator of cytokinesis protein 1-like n=1 Tax=Pomacea canaliculata TaxID=400727 RepID=UPI000D73A7CC|nr:LOW QUALITY PROTEIN: dedicator of cytokinesis protein 1-like [Pomacea canaliculata]